VSQCWKAIPESLIRKSFVGCGITNCTTSDLHSRLKCILEGNMPEEEGQEEHTGLTDGEAEEGNDSDSDDEE
jgi:hypothetical protein